MNEELDLSTPEGQAAYEANARLYSEITHEAREIYPLLTQSFKMRIKSGVSNPLAWSISPKNDAHLLGKWIEVKVDWEITNGCNMFVLRHNYHLLQFTEAEFIKHVTKKGMAHKMLAAWKLSQETE
jgi:hypothetical protein